MSFETDLDELLRKTRAYQHAVHVANSCDTPYDHKKAREAEETYLDAKDAFIRSWGEPDTKPLRMST